MPSPNTLELRKQQLPNLQGDRLFWRGDMGPAISNKPISRQDRIRLKLINKDGTPQYKESYGKV